jgi:hypothetical protein
MSRKVIMAFYKDLFEALQLSPDEIEQFVRMREGAPAERMGGMIDLLGPAGFERYRNYTSDIGARMRLRELNTKLELTGEPLRPYQKALLLKIMREEQLRPPLDFERRVEARAANVLTETQLVQFRRSWLRLAVMRFEAWRKERRARRRRNGGPRPPYALE